MTPTVSSPSGSGTQISAFLDPRASRWRSTQFTHAFSFPPTNHFQNGGLLVSRIVSQRVSQVSRSAYSVKHSGKCSSLNRSRMAGSAALAWAANPGGGA